MLGHVMAGTPTRRTRVFSSRTRARLTISRASSASVFSLPPGLGRFQTSHGVDCDKGGEDYSLFTSWGEVIVVEGPAVSWIFDVDGVE